MTDFNREWTQFWVDAEIEHFGSSRLVKAHNQQVAALEQRVEGLEKAGQDLLDWHDGVLGRGPALDSAKASLRKALAEEKT